MYTYKLHDPRSYVQAYISIIYVSFYDHFLLNLMHCKESASVLVCFKNFENENKRK
jgi:hypothetical protein